MARGSYRCSTCKTKRYFNIDHARWHEEVESRCACGAVYSVVAGNAKLKARGRAAPYDADAAHGNSAAPADGSGG